MMTKIQVKAALRELFKCKGGIFGVLMLALAIPALALAAPNATEILERARLAQGSQHRVLLCQLRTGPNKIPFRLILNGPEIRYEFSNPKQILVVKLGEESSRMEEITKDGTQRVPFSHFDDLVRGSNASYEDLAFRFLYWKNAKILGQESFKTISHYKMELHPGATSSQYGTVLAWIGVGSGALAKAECYNRQGKPVVRFEVASVGRLRDGTGIFKSMRIERMVDGQAQDASRSYLEITGEE